MGYLHAFGVSRRNRVERRYLPSAKFGLSRFISDISVPFWPQIVIFGVFKQIYLGCLRFTRTADVFSSMVSLHRATLQTRRTSLDADRWRQLDGIVFQLPLSPQRPNQVFQEQFWPNGSFSWKTDVGYEIYVLKLIRRGVYNLFQRSLWIFSKCRKNHCTGTLKRW